MKAIKVKDSNYWNITKGKTSFNIHPGTDRYPFLPVRIEYEGVFYPIYAYTLIDVIKKFENTYSEEQVLEKLIEFTCK